MVRIASAAVLLLASTLTIAALSDDAKPPKTEPMVGHMVYFKLKDGSPEARKTFLDSCNSLLSDHEGTVFYSAGVLADEFKGGSNDREWDIALHVVFKDKAAHDKYQVHPNHKKFVADNKDAMDKVRVFDSALDAKKLKLASGK